MKTIKNLVSNEIKRVEDKTAMNLVDNKIWKYVPKSDWKKIRK
jgi:hypothetical protein